MVTLNPFRVSPVPESTSAQSLSKVPDTLGFDLTHTKLALLEQIIGNCIVVHHTHPTSEPFNLQTATELLQKLPALSFTS